MIELTLIDKQKICKHFEDSGDRGACVNYALKTAACKENHAMICAVKSFRNNESYVTEKGYPVKRCNYCGEWIFKKKPGEWQRIRDYRMHACGML